MTPVHHTKNHLKNQLQDPESERRSSTSANPDAARRFVQCVNCGKNIPADGDLDCYTCHRRFDSPAPRTVDARVKPSPEALAHYQRREARAAAGEIYIPPKGRRKVST